MYMEADIGRVWSGTQREELDVMLIGIGALLNLDSSNEKEARILNSGGCFLVERMGCL